MQYAIIDADVVVNVIVWDGESEWEPDDKLTVIDISDISPVPGIGWSFDGTNFIAPPEPEKSEEELIAEAKLQKQAYIDHANDYMNDRQWPGKAVLGRLTEAEKEQYNLWLDYLNALEAVDTSSAPDINWPLSPEV